MNAPRRISYILVCAMVLVFVLSPTARAANQSALSGPVTVDTPLFDSSIPSQLNVGQNYSVRVLLTNIESQEIPIIVTISVPSNYIIANPLAQRLVVGPHQSVLTIFYLVPYAKHSGLLSITLGLYIANGTGIPIAIGTLTRDVDGIQSSVIPTIVTVTVIGIIITVSAVFAVRALIRRPSPDESQDSSK